MLYYKHNQGEEMKIVDLYLENKNIFNQGLERSITIKVATDSAQAGGVMLEMDVEQLVNDILNKINSPFIMMTNKGISRHLRRGYSFDFSSIGANNLDEFKSLIKTSNSFVSSADVYLFERIDNNFRLVDAQSFKTSTSDASNIYLHNDADGSIFEGVINRAHPNFGQILMLDFSPTTGNCIIYLIDGNMSKLVDLFTNPIEKPGEIVFKGNDLKDKTDMTNKSGLNRILIKLINRKNKKKKKDSTEDLASTSFSRGILIDKRFLPILASRGLIQELHSFNLNFDAIEEEDFVKRYKQTKEQTNDNAA